jgi:molybdopterin synthase catalytic subunit
VASFVGRVRETNDDQAIEQLELEHYPGMTEKVMHEVLLDARERWPLLGARVIHRVGALAPGDNIVLVLTSSAHRHAALDACAFIMDHLKTRATFWKKEQTPQGHRWVKGRDSDQEAQARWHAKD